MNRVVQQRVGGDGAGASSRLTKSSLEEFEGKVP
jgi:hypothetical protein